ncbi:MAG: DUF2378 family protein [Myxococcota bacterium]
MPGSFASDAAFRAPDLASPLDVEGLLAAGPPRGLVKGMFFEAVRREVRRAGAPTPGRDRYTAFRGYPLEEWLVFLPECASRAFPGLPAREGMRRFGHGAFRAFQQSTAGRVLFSFAGQDTEAAARLTGRAFDAIASHGRVEVRESGPGHVVLRLTDMWDYIEGWHVGVYEGATRALGAVPIVEVRMDTPRDGDVRVSWDGSRAR